MPAPAAQPQTVRVHAAGSLRPVLTDLADWLRQPPRDIRLNLRFGAAGLLRGALLAGEPSDLFLSANQTHPEALHAAGFSGPVQCFARNALCALVAPHLDPTPQTLVEHLFRPDLRVGTSTPGNDPSGDYAWELFRLIGKRRPAHPDAFAALSRKALQLTGGPQAPPKPAGRYVYAALVADGQADIFLIYRSNARIAQRYAPDLRCVDLPDDLRIGAAYGLTVLRDAVPATQAVVEALLGEPGQGRLLQHGFELP